MSDDFLDVFPHGNIESRKNKTGENLTERERECRMKFPEKWFCPYCAANGLHETIDRDDILGHVTGEHRDEVENATWESFYNRMVQVGGL